MRVEDSELDNLSADLAAAWDGDPETDEVPAEEEELAPEGAEGEETPPEGDETPPEGEELAGGDSGTGAEDFAPKSLSATAREAWRDTPAAMKAEITKRERDYEQGIQKYAEQARRADGMDASLAPYQQFLQMNGGPGQALQSLLQVGSGLQMGSPIQKAEIIGNLIKQFGVDIPALDGLLSGNGAPQDMQQQNEVQLQVNAALAPYQQYMAQQQEQQRLDQAQATGQVNGEITTFSSAPENEFYNDVKMQMADILDLASNRGQQMGLKEAYATACQLNPEIKKIIDGRVLAEGAASRRRAGSSIHGSPGGPGGGGPQGGMRSAIEEAWDAAGRD